MNDKEQNAVAGMEAICMRRAVKKWAKIFQAESDKLMIDLDLADDSLDLEKKIQVCAEIGLISKFCEVLSEVKNRADEQLFDAIDKL